MVPNHVRERTSRGPLSPVKPVALPGFDADVATGRSSWSSERCCGSQGINNQ